jgi:beta-glucosidase-like glycosyl hydrolase
MLQVAREDWGFQGYITTDCDGFPQSYLYHNETYKVTPEEGVRDMLRAGVDIDCVRCFLSLATKRFGLWLLWIWCDGHA